MVGSCPEVVLYKGPDRRVFLLHSLVPRELVGQDALKQSGQDISFPDNTYIIYYNLIYMFVLTRGLGGTDVAQAEGITLLRRIGAAIPSPWKMKSCPLRWERIYK